MLLVLNRWSLRGPVGWGVSLALAVTFLSLPVSAQATGGMLAANVSGWLSADDPRIELTPPPPPPPKPTVHEILAQAAHDQGVDPNLLLAVSYWESSWNQSAVSSEGAIGLLQVMPKTAEAAGPRFLAPTVHLYYPADHA